MKYYNLDKEEKLIEADFEAGNYRSVRDADSAISKYQSFARNTLEKTKNINIRLSEKDLLKIKARAASLGLPYQTLVSSVLHRYFSKV